MRPRTDLAPEEFHDAVETAQAIKACKRVKIVDLASFIQACKNNPTSAERIGGFLIDMTTKSMVSQVWDFIQKHESGDKAVENLTKRFNGALEKYGKKVAIIDVIDRFWRFAR
jgi:hypothetical protein